MFSHFLTRVFVHVRVCVCVFTVNENAHQNGDT